MKILNNPRYSGVGRFLWDLADNLYYVDDNGNRFCVPMGFRHDKRSSRKWMWTWIPPSVGLKDVIWTIHDFESRCYSLLGLSLRDVDGSRFVSSMRSMGKSRTRSLIHSWGVRIASRAVRNSGDGWHRDGKFNADVFDTESDKNVSLVNFVKTYYNSDGTGLNDQFTFPVEVL